MAKFAAVYDLPAGEQMLVTVFDHETLGPVVQYATEIHGEIVSAEIPLCPEGTYLERMSAREEARNVIFNYTEDDIKDFRRRFVRDVDVAGGIENKKEELECLPN